MEIPEEEQEIVRQELFETYSCYPVFLSDEIADAHYNGFSNGLVIYKSRKKKYFYQLCLQLL